MAEVDEHPRGHLTQHDGIMSVFFEEGDFGLSGASIVTTRYQSEGEIVDEITATIFIGTEDVKGPEIEVRRNPDGGVSVQISSDVALYIVNEEENTSKVDVEGNSNVVQLFTGQGESDAAS